MRMACLAALLAATACTGSTVKDTLGLNRSSPDEFRVVSRPPLSVPPDFALRPPGTPGESRLMPPASAQAKSLITGEPVQPVIIPLPSSDQAKTVAPASVAPSSPESQFLKRAGADQANNNIRAELEADKATASIIEPQEDKAWWDVFSSDAPKKDPMVDAKKEAERIKDDKASGKSVTEGETPEVKPKDTGVLGQILGY